MLARIQARISDMPGRQKALIGGGIGLVIVLSLTSLYVFVIRPGVAYETLSSNNPALLHPDGIAVRLAEGSDSLSVRIDTVPREVFSSDLAGKEWQVARMALPPSLTPLSPIYTIDTRGAGQIVAEMSMPNGAEPLALLDVYCWDSKGENWVFVPSHIDPARQLIVFQPEVSSLSVMAFHSAIQSPAVAIIASEGSSGTAGNYGLVFPEGVRISASGEMLGSPIPASASAVMPLIRNREGGLRDYNDPTRRFVLIDQLMSILSPYDGLVLDFEVGDGYVGFIDDLAKQVHAHGKRLDVIIHGQELHSGDLAELGQIADRVWFMPGDDPNLYLPSGAVRDGLDELVGTVERTKLGLLVSGLNVDVAGDGTSTTIRLDDAMALFGDVQIVEGYLSPYIPLEPGGNLPLHLTGQVESMGFDASLGVNYLTYRDAAGQVHTVYFGSAQNLRQKLAWANYYGLSGVAVYGLAHAEAPEHLADGLSAFLHQQPISDPVQMAIVWRVQSSAGANLSETQGDLSLIQYLWQAASEPGQYVVSAFVRDQAQENLRGQVAVEVGEAAPLPTPTPTPTPTQDATNDPNATPAPQPTSAPPAGSLAPGSFELGGQTHTLGHPNEMHYAGMAWVKFQHKWGEGDDPAGALGGRIQQAHAQGFKVLLSIPGPEHPASINYTAYVNFLAGVAALGPDAIEVWNEMNLTVEWPLDQINGANYVNNMLAPAYQAIKAANPNVMVISGAPAPTGLYGSDGCGPLGCADLLFIQQMRDAGGANHLDCVGVHYNEGIISPSQTSGDPRGDNYYTRYFFGMVNYYYGTLGKPLCFTELGYVSGDGWGALPASFSWGSGTTAAQQAQWLAEAAVLSSQGGKVRLMIVWNVDIFGQQGAQGAYAIIRPDGGCPACDALHAIQP